MKRGDRVTPVGNVPRAGQVGIVAQIMTINGMLWADIRFSTPEKFGRYCERIGVAWLVPA